MARLRILNHHIPVASLVALLRTHTTSAAPAAIRAAAAVLAAVAAATAVEEIAAAEVATVAGAVGEEATVAEAVIPEGTVIAAVHQNHPRVRNTNNFIHAPSRA